MEYLRNLPTPSLENILTFSSRSFNGLPFIFSSRIDIVYSMNYRLYGYVNDLKSFIYL